ncbi:MAG: 5'-nucleotidase C-terminal domain-containing protein [Ferruginibacter sp.]|nr:5'-nucleotidase C-terminal domain-containing protein [Ferruginibacter sp.]
MHFKKINIYFSLFFLSALFFSCQTFYQPQSVQYKDYRLTNYFNKDSAMQAALKPYSDSVNKSMNDIIVVSEIELEKKQPEGNLGNLMADAMLSMAKEKYKQSVDAAFINFGGIRQNAIPAGNITRGKLFELAPFDNIIVLQKVSGKILQEFLDHISGRGGWPTAGMQWQIKNLPTGQAGKKAINVKVGGNAISESSTYTIALVDYVANGGDDCAMLKTVPQTNNGMLFRDAIIEYLNRMNAAGKKINIEEENRVSHAK